MLTHSPVLLTSRQKLVDLDLADVIDQIPESVARENAVLPIAKVDDKLHLVMEDENDFAKQDKIRFILNCDVIAYQRSRDEIDQAIDHFYGAVEGRVADSMLQEFTDTSIQFCEFGDDSVIEEFAYHDPESVEALSDVVRNERSRHLRRTKQQHSFRSQRAEVDGGRGMFYYTVNEGEKVLVTSLDGKSRIVSGPARVWRGSNRFKQMHQSVAHPGQYLKLMFRDGTQQHLVGPSEAWLDARVHESISIEQGTVLATNEAVVVYGEADEDFGESDVESKRTDRPTVARRVFYGPGTFIPKPGEWLHQFSWHASEGGSRGVEKRPHGRVFERLWLMPDQMYHDVRDVRTADDAVLTIRLMIFFELRDIEKMLDTTHDPIGDFVNAATSDVVEFVGKRTFDEFKRETELLNDTQTYSQLINRASQCGYQINNVVYRGYGAPESLQRMHDEAIQSRTKLRLERETEQQAQDLEDYKLQCQMQRASRRREEQSNEVSHELELDRKKRESQRQADYSEAENRREIGRLEAQLRNELETVRLATQRTHLDAMRDMGVDLTKYLTQGRADKVIEMRGGNSQPHVHLPPEVADRS